MRTDKLFYEIFLFQVCLIEAILGSKFPDLNLEEIRKMLGLQAEDLSYTKFYQDVLKQGFSPSVVNFLAEKFGSLSPRI